MEYNYDTYMVTCDKCSREWDGNAQCPCGLDISSDDDNLLLNTSSSSSSSSLSSVDELSYFININIRKKFFQIWKNNIKFDKLYQKRYDILYNKWYSKKEMNDFYGNDYIWNQQSPEVLFIKSDLLHLIENCENISIDKIKLFIDVLFTKIY